ncbi:polymorphic toxin-type HINT domain-containing protein [Stackebrandtia soli]
MDRVKVDVTVDVDGDGKGDDTIASTAGHAFWTNLTEPSNDGAKWVPARDLVSGAWLRTSSGTWVQTTALTAETRPVNTYNLTVSQTHTYYIKFANTDALVHNCDDGGFKRPVSEDETSKINQEYGGTNTLHGSPGNALANASRYRSFWEKSAVMIRDIAGSHMFNDGNKRTAHAVVSLLMQRNNVISGPTSADLWNVILRVSDSKKPGHTMDIKGIASMLRGF